MLSFPMSFKQNSSIFGENVKTKTANRIHSPLPHTSRFPFKNVENVSNQDLVMLTTGCKFYGFSDGGTFKNRRGKKEYIHNK